MNSTAIKPSILQRGLTLVELMVAMAVGLILMAGVLKIYLSSKQSDRILTAEARMQENGRYAMHFLVDDIRMAGYTGCNSIANVTPDVISDNPPTDAFSNADMIVGYDYPQSGTVSWPTNLPGTAPTNIVPGTSVIALQFGASDGANVTGNVVPANSNVQVSASGSGGWTQGSNVLITDCSHAALFCVTNVTGGASSGSYTLAYGNSCNTTNRIYQFGTDAQVMTYESNMYYIGYNSDDPDSANAKGRPALYRLDASGNSEALVNNVQDMSVLYGVDTDSDGSANEYLTAAQVTSANDWINVVSARVDLLMASNDDHLAPSPETLPFAGGTYTATDHRLYWSFGDTVVLRNRTH